MTFDWSAKTILIAEDEPANFLFIERVLRPTNVTIIRAEDGESAINIVKDNLAIDAVLMDIYMPGMDGFEASEIIRKIRPNLPIIAQTFYENQLEKVKIEDACFDDLIRKPVNINKLLVILEKHLKTNPQTV